MKDAPINADGGATRLAARRPREAAEAHFRKLGGTSRSPAVAPARFKAPDRTPGTFEIYREDEVRMTSTRFSGGDWHWRLSDAEGLILLDTGGYPSERKCREAIAVLKENAAFASVSRAG